MENKKRIAFCLFGQVRFAYKLKEYYDFLCSNDDYIVDIFIATWNDFDTDLLKVNFKDKLFLSTQVMDKVGEGGNTPRMAYLISKSIELKRKAEFIGQFKYDYVIVKRADLVLQKESFYNSLETIDFSEDTLPCVHSMDKFKLEKDHGRKGVFPIYSILQDYMFVENSLAADLHSLMYSFFYIHKHHLNLNTSYREGGHWNHIYFFKYFNFDIKHSNFIFYLIRPLLDHKVFEEYCTSDSLIQELVKNKEKYKSENTIELMDQVNSFGFKDKII
tara:strand:- start:260 stop:1081 length:822 start_codon:yes stop_codon:yes gene_type:complete